LGALVGVPLEPMLNMFPPAAAACAACAACAAWAAWAAWADALGYPGGACGIPPNEAPKDGGAAVTAAAGADPAGFPNAKLAGMLLFFCNVAVLAAGPPNWNPPPPPAAAMGG
jgi:hypothetical protein